MKERSTMALVGNRPTPAGLHKNHEMTYRYSRMVSAIKHYAVATQVQQGTAVRVSSSEDMSQKEPKKMGTSSLLAKRKFWVYVHIPVHK